MELTDITTSQIHRVTGSEYNRIAKSISIPFPISFSALLMKAPSKAQIKSQLGAVSIGTIASKPFSAIKGSIAEDFVVNLFVSTFLEAGLNHLSPTAMLEQNKTEGTYGVLDRGIMLAARAPTEVIIPSAIFAIGTQVISRLPEEIKGLPLEGIIRFVIPAVAITEFELTQQKSESIFNVYLVYFAAKGLSKLPGFIHNHPAMAAFIPIPVALIVIPIASVSGDQFNLTQINSTELAHSFGNELIVAFAVKTAVGCAIEVAGLIFPPAAPVMRAAAALPVVTVVTFADLYTEKGLVFALDGLTCALVDGKNITKTDATLKIAARAGVYPLVALGINKMAHRLNIAPQNINRISTIIYAAITSILVLMTQVNL